MRVTLENTDKVVELTDEDGGRLPARVWEGRTEGGVPVIAYITRLCAATDDPAACAEFERDLQRVRAPRPSPAVEAIPLRLIL